MLGVLGGVFSEQCIKMFCTNAAAYLETLWFEVEGYERLYFGYLSDYDRHAC